MRSNPEISLVKISNAHPRRNLPASFVKGREEENFVIAFGQAYIHEMESQVNLGRRFHASGRELPVTGFGIADFVWIGWCTTTSRQQGQGLSARHPSRIQKATVLAFEMKLVNWRRALSQALRYRYFANAAFVVLPPESASRARKGLSLFRDLQVGLWSFDDQTGLIHKIFTPRRCHPLSDTTRAKAISVLTKSLRIPPVA